jgi:monoamine oxidase
MAKRRSPLPEPLHAHVTRWGRDPWARGAYSFLAEGASPKDRKRLREPIGERLHLAGEASSRDFPATVHGALLEGRRAARAVRRSGSRGDRVVVVGAGAAGLAATRALARRKFRVVVVEARDRIGGRVHSCDDSGAMVEHGAQWIHGTDGNPLTKLARRAGCTLHPTDYEALAVRDATGHPVHVPAAAVDTIVELFYGADPFGDLAALRARMQDSDATLLDYLLTSIVEHELGANLEALSPLAYDEGEEHGEPDAVVAEGLSAVLAPLAEDLDLRLESPVQEIRWSEQGVSVATVDEALTADHCVCTLPLGVLQAGAVSFDPPLPARTRRAIERLGVGHLEKLILRFERPFWDEGAVMLGHLPLERGHFVEWLNLLPLTGRPVLVGFNAAGVALGYGERTDAEVIAAGLLALERMYG